jgi:hypothetical protein
LSQTTDDQPDFTDAFCEFLQACVTSVDAAELLLALSREPASEWAVKDLKAQPTCTTVMSDAEVTKYLEAFEKRGIVVRAGRTRFRYLSTADDAHVETLSRLYVERPVTLFRLIYALRDSSIKTFADAFRIWRR